MPAIINSLFGNWKTTLTGVLAAVVTGAAAYLNGQTGIWPYVGAALLALNGMVGKDATTGSQALTPKPSDPVKP